MIAIMHDALSNQLIISNSHLLKTLSDELYSANFLSIRCVKSSDDFASSEESRATGVCCPLYRPRRCVHGSRYRIAFEREAISVKVASKSIGP